MTTADDLRRMRGGGMMGGADPAPLDLLGLSTMNYQLLAQLVASVERIAVAAERSAIAAERTAAATDRQAAAVKAIEGHIYAARQHAGELPATDSRFR